MRGREAFHDCEIGEIKYDPSPDNVQKNKEGHKFHVDTCAANSTLPRW